MMPTQEEIAEAMRLLGYDPEETKALIVTSDTVVGIDVNYPEPWPTNDEENDDGN